MKRIIDFFEDNKEFNCGFLAGLVVACFFFYISVDTRLLDLSNGLKEIKENTDNLATEKQICEVSNYRGQTCRDLKVINNIMYDDSKQIKRSVRLNKNFTYEF